VTVAIAPRWNVLAVTTETPDVAAAFLVAGEAIDTPRPAPATPAGDDPLAFTIEDRKTRRSSSAGLPKPPPAFSIPDDEIPF